MSYLDDMAEAAAELAPLADELVNRTPDDPGAVIGLCRSIEATCEAMRIHAEWERSERAGRVVLPRGRMTSDG